MRAVGFFVGVWLIFASASQAEFTCAGFSPVGGAAKTEARSGSEQPLPARGQVRALVVFAQFGGEPAARVPGFGASLFDPEMPGSLAHFYRTLSAGQLQLSGTVLPRRYASPQPARHFLTDGEEGRYGEFAAQILAQVDADLDLRGFDNDGADRVADSGDDDGVVDYVFLVLRSVPRRFLKGAATGVAGLGVRYCSADIASGGRPVCAGGSRRYGAIVEEGSFSQTVGAMAHEFGHGLGLPDLYDPFFTEPAQDSAGLGRWCLMAWGAHGWNGDDGPNPLSAWCLEQLGWIGPENQRLKAVAADTADLLISPLFAGGTGCKVPLRATFLSPVLYVQEYLLLEQRTRAANYYDRHLPAEGLLVWHVRPRTPHNGQEEKKRVDLVCADGLRQGGDDLDFWAHDAAYTAAHGGNLGDAGDPFDGIRQTRFDLSTNPSTAFGQSLPHTGLALCLHRQGDSMRLEVALPRWAGVLRQEAQWVGEVLMDGDLEIAPEGRLVLYPGTTVRVAGTDRQRGGADPSRCELRVWGTLEVHRNRLLYYDGKAIQPVASAPVVFAGASPAAQWQGMVIEEGARLLAPPGSLVLQDTLRRLPQVPPPLRLFPNHPNPFNAQTLIRYDLSRPSWVEVRIYNLLGQPVRRLRTGFQPAGVQEVGWDGRDERDSEVAGGVYFCRVEVDGKYSESQRLLLAR